MYPNLFGIFFHQNHHQIHHHRIPLQKQAIVVSSHLLFKPFDCWYDHNDDDDDDHHQHPLQKLLWSAATSVLFKPFPDFPSGYLPYPPGMMIMSKIIMNMMMMMMMTIMNLTMILLTICSERVCKSIAIYDFSSAKDCQSWIGKIVDCVKM